ncbi:MAG TPA: tetratricopeptide repeat protein [Terriglobia bacterium]|nr:tetratricopeptide repeat protein [Terriglobia bacterium]
MPTENLEQRLQRGLDALNRADFLGAIDDLGEVVAEDPSNAAAWRALGVCYLEMRQPANALEALERSLSADPEQPDTHYVLGSACGTLGQLERAAACYRRALELDPDHAKAEEFLVRTEALLESREHYRRGLKLLHGGEPNRDDLNQALRELVQSAAIFDGSPARESLAHCAQKLLALRQEATPVESGTPLTEDWTRACERGFQCTRFGNWVGAREAYQDALVYRVGDAFVHHALGFSFLFLGEPEEAVRAWLRTLELDPDYDFTRFGRAQQSSLS